jgi:integrase
MPLQKVRGAHLDQYYASATVSASTLTLHHTILHQALRKAAKDRLIETNPAADLDHKPRRTREKVTEGAQSHAWTATEARAFLAAARAAGPRPAAFYTLAIDPGARKGELCGLLWSNLDLGAVRCGSSSSC